ncbi:MAG TPA: hypothetical protein VM841_05450 [Actinomycetota bacterium]|nr:hypothetical protein [Actinomycetota bacterium]
MHTRLLRRLLRRPLRPLLSLGVLLALVACSGGPSKDPRFTGAAGEPAKTSVSPEAEPRQGSGEVELPGNLPPAAMFLGSGSHRTTPARYCVGEDCALLKPPAPPALEGPAESPVLFTLSAAPLRARLEVSAAGKAPEIVALTPGSSMSWQPAMPPGQYRLALTAIYDTTEVSWPFALKIVEGTRR